MSRRPVNPAGLTRGLQRMTPGGRLYSEMPIRSPSPRDVTGSLTAGGGSEPPVTPTGPVTVTNGYSGAFGSTLTVTWDDAYLAGDMKIVVLSGTDCTLHAPVGWSTIFSGVVGRASWLGVYTTAAVGGAANSTDAFEITGGVSAFAHGYIVRNQGDLVPKLNTPISPETGTYGPSLSSYLTYKDQALVVGFVAMSSSTAGEVVHPYVENDALTRGFIFCLSDSCAAMFGSRPYITDDLHTGLPAVNTQVSLRTDTNPDYSTSADHTGGFYLGLVAADWHNPPDPGPFSYTSVTEYTQWSVWEAEWDIPILAFVTEGAIGWVEFTLSSVDPAVTVLEIYHDFDWDGYWSIEGGPWEVGDTITIPNFNANGLADSGYAYMDLPLPFRASSAVFHLVSI